MSTGIKGKMISVVVVGAVLVGAYHFAKPDFEELPKPKPDSKPEERHVRVQVSWTPGYRDPAVDYRLHVGPVPVVSQSRNNSPFIWEGDVPVGVSVRVDGFQFQKGRLECAIFVNMFRRDYEVHDGDMGVVTCIEVIK